MSSTSWWNNATKQYDHRDPVTDEIARQYIPQNDPAQNLYNLYRDSGMSILKAMANVLHASNGEAAPFPLGSK